MITPRFLLSQDENTCTIKIRAPYCSLRELDISVDETLFIFVCKPYYLRINLPGSIIENDYSKSSFDADTGEFTFNYEKAIPGEDFKDLEFITKFLTPKLEVTDNEGGRKIEVLTSEGDLNSNPEVVDTTNEFGFAMQGHYQFSAISSEFGDVFEIDPREVNLTERRRLKLQYEQGKFDSDHYLADYIEDEEIKSIISLKTPWESLKSETISFNDAENDFLKDLTNIEYNLTETQIKYCHCGLLDILFAYCYDRRTTFYEGTPESSWTIGKIAATFCWLDGYQEPKDALVSCFRRSLIYPLYRHFDLTQKIFSDVKEILQLGEKYMIKCLIELYNVFLRGDCGNYILNNLFIKDYILYLMKWNKDSWKKIVDEVMSIEIKKSDLGLNLEEIERGYQLGLHLANLNLDKDSDDDDSTLDSESDSDDYDSDTDSSSSSFASSN